MDVIRGIDQLFRDHAPETLMALFGALTSVGLFYLVWTVLRHLVGIQTRRLDDEVVQDKTTATLVEALVNALVTEASHLRATLDNILEEALRRSEENAQALSTLCAQAEEGPDRVLDLLRPEFDQLRRALHQAETRIITKITQQASEPEGAEVQDDPELGQESEV